MGYTIIQVPKCIFPYKRCSSCSGSQVAKALICHATVLASIARHVSRPAKSALVNAASLFLRSGHFLSKSDRVLRSYTKFEIDPQKGSKWVRIPIYIGTFSLFPSVTHSLFRQLSVKSVAWKSENEDVTC